MKQRQPVQWLVRGVVMGLGVFAQAQAQQAAPPGGQGGPPAGGGPPMPGREPEVDHGSECSSACLTQMVETYLTAFGKRDPGGLPVAPTIKAAENSHRIALGENAWRTVVRVRPQKMVFTDPFAGEVVAIGSFEMAAQEPFLYVLRLKLDKQRIVESEMMVTADRFAGQHFKPDTVTTFEPLLTQEVPAASRATRAQLLDQARGFWGEGEGFKSASDCIHTENGDAVLGGRTGCPPAGKAGNGSMFTAQRGIRHVLADVEHGIVITYVNQDATPRPRTPPEGEKTPIFYQRPVTFYALNLLKVAGGEVKREALFANVQEANAPLPFAD